MKMDRCGHSICSRSNSRSGRQDRNTLDNIFLLHYNFNWNSATNYMEETSRKPGRNIKETGASIFSRGISDKKNNLNTHSQDL